MGDSAQFSVFDKLVLHESLGDATTSQQRQGYTTKNRTARLEKTKGNAATEGLFSLFLFFTHK